MFRQLIINNDYFCHKGVKNQNNTLNGSIIVGWVEVRNPTKTYLILGFTSLKSNDEKLSF
jgi:hypothetical protein